MLRALGSASCDIKQETGGTIYYGHWVLRLVTSHTIQGGTICYGRWVLCLAISHTEQGVRLARALGFASCDMTDETGQTVCFGHWVLRLVISHTRPGVRFVTGIGFHVL